MDELITKLPFLIDTATFLFFYLMFFSNCVPLACVRAGAGGSCGHGEGHGQACAAWVEAVHTHHLIIYYRVAPR